MESKNGEAYYWVNLLKNLLLLHMMNVIVKFWDIFIKILIMLVYVYLEEGLSIYFDNYIVS